MSNYLIVDIYRLCFTILVCFMHFESTYFSAEHRFFEGGYLAVDFFFVLSGYLLFKTFESKKYESAENYLFARVKSFLPYNLFMLSCFFAWDVLHLIPGCMVGGRQSGIY